MTYKKYFEEYSKTAFQLEVDLKFWRHFLSTSIANYQLDNPTNRRINEAGISLYNLQPDKLHAWLHVSDNTSTIETKDLEKHSEDFFSWVMNLSMVRLYNASELFILNAIQLKYFPHLNPIDSNKRNANKIIAEIKNHLINSGKRVDTTNNKHIIDFLKEQSSDFKSFLKLKVNTDWTTTWEGFYELFSILRNIIAHHAMTITPDIKSNINSIAKDAFKYCFIQLSKSSNLEILKAKSDNEFLFFVSHINNFVVNTVKFIAAEVDFEFIGLHKA